MTKKEFIKKQKNRILKIKIKLVNTFKRELKFYFARQTKRLRSGNRQLIEIIPFLDRQYNRIAKELLNTKNKKENDNIEKVIGIFLFGHAKKQANFINETTIKNIEFSIELAMLQLAEGGEFNPSTIVINRVAANIFRRLSKNRPFTISLTETQEVTEGLRFEITKETHRELEDVIVNHDKERAEELYLISQDYTTYEISLGIGIQTNAKLFATLALAKKMWLDVGDAKVRKAHRLASGQTVLVNEPFIVNNELLMFPGDTSLGASIENVVRCRCVDILL